MTSSKRWRSLNGRPLRKLKLPIILFVLVLLVLGSGAAYAIVKHGYRSYRGRPPSQIHMTWDGDSATSIVFQWRTRRRDTPSQIDYRLIGESDWRRVIGNQQHSYPYGALHEAKLNHLLPSSTYEYRIKGDFLQKVWSQTYQFQTSPARGESDFDAIYFADTGLVGRNDGLATGTKKIIQEIANQKPLLTLAGGDYAYYNTDHRHGSLDASIDAWFDQMTPVFNQSVVMPTYGNHETQLQENYTLWAERFETPIGTPDGRNYSFDVGNAHFVSIFAIYEQQGLEPEALDWIKRDIEDAQAAGQQWIIPFMHVSAFAEGASHPSNLALRAQLGPLFESLGIKVVLSSHDQAYERTYPLVNVPDQNVVTSSSKSCYTMSDGVTWVKSSPGGKESNKSGSFSLFKADPSPWVAVRDNTMHVFTKLHFSKDELSLETFGIKGNSPPTVLDTFSYTTKQCNA